ncbi:hypothetical protein DQ04_05811030 [Trypanosoma grayi]|uniref:hypothetical protein n=1 Tax=Trypanosoma grayi TaxID=71804 RepID=UPI0004F47518|nr:hypothetical protein DQ04_05811030 [Trypanosoma grayi]KEG09106.1 hypothetical protein DQ04_05811030 [Trypanosoma grayi]
MGKGEGLHSLELKALSVPASLRFLLGVEYDVVLCVTEVGNRRSCTIRFPALVDTFQKLLGFCAERFGLECKHYDDHSLLSGTAMMPPLRYVDYLPGALHVEEILECLGVKPATAPERYGESAHDFLASFIDYSEYHTDASLADVHGTGFYLTLDYGLCTATHSHLVEIRFHKGYSTEEALREFEEFSGWNTFDLRFDDENDKHAGGVVVMPSIQDACDLFEKYEDEDSDDEGELLPFVLRPFAPLVAVPSVEDSALKKLRDQHWGEIEKFWERFPKWRNCVVVSNLYESASLEETLAFFDGLTITDSSLVEDNSPARRRRVFVTFATSDAAKKALSLDGRSTKGKTLRVQVSPPYVDESRRGRVVGSHSASVSEPPIQTPEVGECTASSSPPLQEKREAGAGGGFEVTAPPGREQRRSKRDGDDKKWDTPVLVSSTPKLVGAAAVAEAEESRSSTSMPPHSTMPAQPFSSPPLVASTMNANAREFIPSSAFQVNANSPEFYPSAVPVAYMDECLAPPPPAYPAVAVAPTDECLAPPPPASPAVAVAPVSLLRPVAAGPVHRSPKVGAAPPPYTAPPPYSVAAVQAMHIASQLPPPSSPPM